MITRIARSDRVRSAWWAAPHVAGAPHTGARGLGAIAGALVSLATLVSPLWAATGQEPGPPAQGQAVPAAPRQAGLAPIEQAVCADCHAVEAFRASVHGAVVPCLSCHARDRHREMPLDSAGAARTRSALCARCHADVQASHPAVDGAPRCTDCHSAHADPLVAEAIPSIAKRCGSCHAAEFAGYARGAHAGGLADTPNPDVPSCVTCHPSHGPALSAVATRHEATARCVACHSNDELARRYDLPSMAGRSYADDFHGRTMQFLARDSAGEAHPAVLICADCHGAHDVTWVDRGDMATVCLGCHQTADPKIAGAWLGHEPISRRNGIIVWAIRLFYYVFIPLVLGGLLIHILFDIRHQLRKGRGRARSGAKSTISVTRFSPIERLEHLLSMTTFTLLVLTGLPQAWPASALGSWLIQLFGGIASTRLVHRTTGVVFVTLLVLHVGRAVYGIARNRRLPVMFATRSDFTAVWQTLRHLVGRGSPPKVGKFDFREKFEYWGLFLGGTLMTVTGLLLMFPDGASRLLPGALLVGARVMHGLEATFAVLVVILWHTWGVILRPEVFPLDTSIFTGKISLERLQHEHALEYERIFGTGGAGARRDGPAGSAVASEVRGPLAQEGGQTLGEVRAVRDAGEVP